MIRQHQGRRKTGEALSPGFNRERKPGTVLDPRREMPQAAQNEALQLSSRAGQNSSGDRQTDPGHSFGRVSVTPQTKLKINEPGDALEREADRAAEKVMKGPVAVTGLEEAPGTMVMRETEGKPGVKEEEEKYKDAAKKAGEAFLETDIGKKLKDKVKEKGEEFITSIPGMVITGTAAAGAVGYLVATNKELPIELPEIPLDKLYPGLKMKITYEGPVRNPTKAMFMFSGTFGGPKEEKKPGMTKSEMERAKTAKMAAELAAFREMIKTPEEKKAEEEALAKLIAEKYGPKLPGTEAGMPFVTPAFPSLKLTPPTLEYKKKSFKLLEEELKLDLPGIEVKSEEEVEKKKEEQKETSLQRKAQPGTKDCAAVGDVPPVVHEVLRSPGRPLDPETRAFFEPRFGHDFSRVRVHNDKKAADAARAVNAQAFTVGQKIVFGEDKYTPQSSNGRSLMAHELTHVAQQERRDSTIDNDPIIGPSNDLLEMEARWMERVSIDAGGSNGYAMKGSRGLTKGQNIPMLWRKKSPDLGEMRDRLTKGLFKWSITSADVRRVLDLLKKLNEVDLRDTIAELEKENLVERIFTNADTAEREKEASLFDRIRQMRPGKSLLMHIPEALVCEKPHKGSWEMARSFTGFDHMIETIEKTAWQSPLAKIGILAHGDMGGVIRIGKDIINLATIDNYAVKFRSLSRYLTGSADVYIFGCVSGAGRAGSALMKELSSLLPNRRIIGFNVITAIPEAEAKMPGEMCYWPDIRATDIKSDILKGKIKSRVPANDQASAAKIAKDGKIIKWPADENKERDDGSKLTERKHFEKRKSAQETKKAGK